MTHIRNYLLLLLSLLLACSDNISIPQSESFGISGFDKTTTFCGDILTIYGSGFGLKGKTSKVIFKAGSRYQKDSLLVKQDSLLRVLSLDCIEWNNSKIVVKVPYFATSGKIYVSKGIEKTAPVYLTISRNPPIEMVSISAGSFIMGSKSGFANELPEHNVTLTRPFIISTTEASQELWQSVLNSNPSRQIGNLLPVHNLKWTDAIRFCNELSKMQGFDTCYTYPATDTVGFDISKKGYRLPTEAEWEYACRAGSTGNFSGTGNLDDMGWNDQNSAYLLKSSAMKKANTWGLFDMHGNVWEYCWDYISDDYTLSASTDPMGAVIGSGRVIRGGSAMSGPSFCRSSVRSSTITDSIWCGIRLVRTK